MSLLCRFRRVFSMFACFTHLINPLFIFYNTNRCLRFILSLKNRHTVYYLGKLPCNPLCEIFAKYHGGTISVYYRTITPSKSCLDASCKYLKTVFVSALNYDVSAIYHSQVICVAYFMILKCIINGLACSVWMMFHIIANITRYTEWIHKNKIYTLAQC